MKFAFLLLSAVSLSATAATVKLTVNTENFDVSKTRNAYVSFESSNILCKKTSMSLMGPVVTNRTDTQDLKVTVVNKNTLSVEASTLYTKDNFCGYNVSGINVSFDNVNWLQIESDRKLENRADVTDVLANPYAEITAVCKKGQCKKAIDGRPVGYASNAMIFSADHKLLEQKNGEHKISVKIKFE